eukprot:14726265-Heterocapsa_arctica.AAC.1
MGPQGSIAKEWRSWMEFEAVAVLTQEEFENLPEGIRVIGTRWVHTDERQAAFRRWTLRDPRDPREEPP